MAKMAGIWALRRTRREGADSTIHARSLSGKGGARNAPAVLITLQWMYIAAPAVATLIGMAAFLGYRLDREAPDRVRALLEEREK